MTMLIAAIIALIASATTALTVSVVLDDWIWLVLYMLTVPAAIATIAALRRQLDFYATTVTVTVLISALCFSWVEAASGYMDIAAWHLFIATFPVAVVVGATGAVFVGLARWRMQTVA